MARYNKLARLLSLAMILSFSTFAQSVPPKLDSIGMERVHRILHDAYQNVKDHYYDPKFHGIDWNARFKDYDAKIGSASSMGQAFSIVAAFLDALKDSHTYFVPPPRAFRLDYGYRMQMIGDKAFITCVRPGTNAEAKIHAGDEVITYNGYTLSRDGFWKVDYYFNSLAPQRTMEIALRDPAGQQRLVHADARVHTADHGLTDVYQLIRTEEEQGHMVRQRYREAGDIMIWKMPLFNMTDEEVDHMFGIARKYKVLIVDLRGNPGGAVQTLERMVGNIFDHDIKIADRIGRKQMKPQLAKTRGDKAFQGKLVVLVDSASASASELFARVVQLESRGMVLGDRTSGKVMEARGYSNSQGTDFAIFYAFSVTDADLVMSDGKSLEQNGVVPDELLLPTARDLAEGKDPVLARAAQIAGMNLDSATAGMMFPFEWLPF